MRISLKILGVLWLILILVIGGLLFNAYKKLKPETFIALLTEQVQKNYPGANLNVGNVSYRFSLDFNLNLEKINLRRNGKVLGSIGEIELKIPWWLLLTNHGNAHITLKDLDIFIDHDESGVVQQPKTPKTEAKSSAIKVSLPTYLADARFTLRAKNISIRDIQNARRFFTVSKLLVREFQTGKNSAFELNIPIEIKHADTQYSSDLWLFGDVTPQANFWKLNYRGEFRTKESNDKIHIEDLVIGGSADFTPSDLKVSSNLELQIDKRTIGTGTFVAGQEKLDLDINFLNFPLNYFDFLYDQIRNPYLKSLEANASGAMKFSKDFETALSTVSGKIGFDGNLMLSEKDFIPGKWQIGFQDTRWEVSFMSPKGEASFFRRSAVNLKKGIVSQYIEELGFSGLDLSVTSSPIQSLPEFIVLATEPYYQTTISYKGCILGENTFDGNFRYGRSPEQKFYQGELRSSKGGSLVFNYSDRNLNQMELIFEKFPWHQSFLFLKPLYAANSGELSGKIQGAWKEDWVSGDWKVQAKTTGVTAMSGKFSDFIQMSFSFFNVNFSDYPGLNITASSKNGSINVTSLVAEDSFPAKITGNLSTRQKSFLTLSYPKNRKAKAVKKEILEPYWIEKDQP